MTPESTEKSIEDSLTENAVTAEPIVEQIEKVTEGVNSLTENQNSGIKMEDAIFLVCNLVKMS